MIRYSQNTAGFGALILAAVAVGLGAQQPQGQRELRSSGKVTGRIVLTLPDNGSFGIVREGDAYTGLRWPGDEGTEFMGGGGLFLRYIPEGASSATFIRPGSFEALPWSTRSAALHEGCESGKRYPHTDRDDDGDGSIDEDPVDGSDNDRDGLVDEDFAAIGEQTFITRAAEAASGLVLSQSCHAWSFGHVRDFVGFTTRLECPDSPRTRARYLEHLQAVLCMDFNVGDPKDGKRGENDRFFIFAEEPAAPYGYHRAAGVAVSAGNGTAACAAVVVFDVRGPGGAAVGAEGLVVAAGASDDSLWAAVQPSRQAAQQAAGVRIEPAGPGGADTGKVPPLPLTWKYTGGRYERVGDRAIAYRFDELPVFKPGDALEIDWALVFGRSREALMLKVSRAVETYRGIPDDTGGMCRWVVPARKAARRKLEAVLTTMWVRGVRQPALAMQFPPELEAEDIEWLKIDDELVGNFDHVGQRLLIAIERDRVERESPVETVGQLTDGTIFSARVDATTLRSYCEGNSLPPGRLPDESLQLFPNPFLTDLNVNVRVLGPVTGSESRSAFEGEEVSSVKVYDVRGRLVRTLLEEEFLPPGEYQLLWDGKDEGGTDVAPGVYYCKLQIESRSLTKRVILLR